MGNREASRNLGSWPSLCDFDQVIGFLRTWSHDLSGRRWLNHMLSRAFLNLKFPSSNPQVSPHFVVGFGPRILVLWPIETLLLSTRGSQGKELWSLASRPRWQGAGAYTVSAPGVCSAVFMKDGPIGGGKFQALCRGSSCQSYSMQTHCPN